MHDMDHEMSGLPPTRRSVLKLRSGDNVGSYRIRAVVAASDHSTEYLVSDKSDNSLAAMEVFAPRFYAGPQIVQANKEHSSALRALKEQGPSVRWSSGWTLIRQISDRFEVDGVDGEKLLCVVQEPVGMSLRAYRKTLLNEQLPTQTRKAVLRDLLACLDYLHHDAGIVHTRINESNIFFRDGDRNPLEQSISGQIESAMDASDGESHDSFGASHSRGSIVLSNFRDAVWGNNEHYSNFARFSRAPETFVGGPWNAKADIWDLGILIWNIFNARQLFSTADDLTKSPTVFDVATIVAICGEPSIDFLLEYPAFKQYFDADGEWLGSVPIPDFTLETYASNTDEEFLDFIRSMLCWMPEERLSAAELRKHPWAQKYLETVPDNAASML